MKAKAKGSNVAHFGKRTQFLLSNLASKVKLGEDVLRACATVFDEQSRQTWENGLRQDRSDLILMRGFLNAFQNKIDDYLSNL